MANKKSVEVVPATEATAVPEAPKSTLSVVPIKVGKTTKVPSCDSCGVKARQVPYFGIDFSADLRVIVCDACARRVRRQIRLARTPEEFEVDPAAA